MVMDKALWFNQSTETFSTALFVLHQLDVCLDIALGHIKLGVIIQGKIEKRSLSTTSYPVIDCENPGHRDANRTVRQHVLW